MTHEALRDLRMAGQLSQYHRWIVRVDPLAAFVDGLGGHLPVVHLHCPRPLCLICHAGLLACERCDAFEGAWPDECPGARMNVNLLDAVYRGEYNFRDGEWRPGECCRAMRPVHYQ